MIRPIEWAPELLTGIHSVDRQHERIVATINALIADWSESPNSEKVDDGMVELSRAVFSHFQHEEHLLVAGGYPDVEAHREEHHRYNAQITAFCQQSMGGESGVDREILMYVRNWWEEHILVVDHRWSPLLQARGVE